MSFDALLTSAQMLVLRQRKELAELFGFETRNKYEIFSQTGTSIGFAAEQQKGILGMLLRQVLGHWRRFDLHVFDSSRQPVMTARHPFRFFFQRMEVFETATNRPLGALQQRFAFLHKKFDVESPDGHIIMQVASPLWRIWTFPFTRGGQECAVITKKWSGSLTEVFTDADNFVVHFADPALKADERKLLLAAALFIDLQYFERKAR